MPGATRVIAAVATLFAAACATSVDVTIDEGYDFSRHQTWTWGSRITRLVGAAADDDREVDALDALTARLIGRELSQRALAHDATRPDLVVAYRLDVARNLVAVNETGAESFLASHHASPSYYVQSTTRRVDVHHDATLRVTITEPSHDRVVWEGELRTQQTGDFARPLQDAVAQLFGRLPAAGGAPRPPAP